MTKQSVKEFFGVSRVLFSAQNGYGPWGRCGGFFSFLAHSEVARVDVKKPSTSIHISRRQVSSTLSCFSKNRNRVIECKVGVKLKWFAENRPSVRLFWIAALCVDERSTVHPNNNYNLVFWKFLFFCFFFSAVISRQCSDHLCQRTTPSRLVDTLRSKLLSAPTPAQNYDRNSIGFWCRKTSLNCWTWHSCN